MPVNRRPTTHVLQEGTGDKPTDGLSGTPERASLVSPKQRIGPLGKQGKGSASLWRCGIVEETKLSVYAAPVQNLLTGGRHALADLALVQMGSQGHAPIAQWLSTLMQRQGA